MNLNPHKNFSHDKFKKILRFLLFIIVYFSVAGIAMAGPTEYTDTGEPDEAYRPPESGITEASRPISAKPRDIFTIQNPLKVDSIGALVKSLIQIFSFLVVILGVLVIIWIGFQYILAAAQGNQAKLKDLHYWLLYVVIGLAIVIAARVIVDVVINTLEATNTVTPETIETVRKANR